jgi:hypothetical protein
MANPNPNITPEFLKTRFIRDDDTKEPMAKQNTQVRLPVSIDEALRQLPSRSAFIRAAIAEKLERDGLLHQGEAS